MEAAETKEAERPDCRFCRRGSAPGTGGQRFPGGGGLPSARLFPGWDLSGPGVSGIPGGAQPPLRQKLQGDTVGLNQDYFTGYNYRKDRGPHASGTPIFCYMIL